MVLARRRCYAVIKVLVAGLDARQAHARKESNLRPAVLETAAPPWLERKRDVAHDVVRGMKGKALQRSVKLSYQRASGLPVLADSRRPGRCS
jgi:hypothetical protein